MATVHQMADAAHWTTDAETGAYGPLRAFDLSVPHAAADAAPHAARAHVRAAVPAVVEEPTGKLELMPPGPSVHVQELAMYDDYINYYGFPRELGFIRVKRLDGVGEADCLLEVIIPRISADGSAAQFRVGAVPGQTMLSMFKRNRGAPRLAQPLRGLARGN